MKLRLSSIVLIYSFWNEIIVVAILYKKIEGS